jgi:hypothetical protein
VQKKLAASCLRSSSLFEKLQATVVLPVPAIPSIQYKSAAFGSCDQSSSLDRIVVRVPSVQVRRLISVDNVES